MFRVNGGPNQRNKMFLNTGHCTAIKLKNHSIKLKLVSIITWINWTFPEIVNAGPLNSAQCSHGSPKVSLSRPPAVSSSHLTQKCRPRTVPIELILYEPPPPRSLLILIATQVVYFTECCRASYTFLFTLYKVTSIWRKTALRNRWTASATNKHSQENIGIRTRKYQRNYVPRKTLKKEMWKYFIDITAAIKITHFYLQRVLCR